MSDQVIWGIHAGKTGDADKLFLGQNVIAIGWDEFGDLGAYKTRDQYKSRYTQIYPTALAGGVATSAGQLYRFVHEMKVGDLVAYPSKLSRQVHIGEITGGYQYLPDVSSGYPNQRPVKWLKETPRTALSSGVLFELGSAMSLFQVKTHAAELKAALVGRVAVEQVVPDADTSAGIDADEAEQLTRDFILKRIAQQLKGLLMEDLVEVPG